jgi:DNA-binding transcriptional LysR family regulator
LQHDYVGMGEHASLQAFLVRMATEAGLPVKLRIQATSFESLCGLVESGIGLGVIPRSAALRHAKKMRIAAVPLRDAWAKRELRIGVRDTASLTSATIALIEALSAEAETGEA